MTGVLLLSESHVAIHTWPERAFATADLYTCGGPDGAARPRRAHETLRDALGAKRTELLLVQRSDGTPDGPPLDVADRWEEG